MACQAHLRHQLRVYEVAVPAPPGLLEESIIVRYVFAARLLQQFAIGISHRPGGVGAIPLWPPWGGVVYPSPRRSNLARFGARVCYLPSLTIGCGQRRSPAILYRECANWGDGVLYSFWLSGIWFMAKGARQIWGVRGQTRTLLVRLVFWG